MSRADEYEMEACFISLIFKGLNSCKRFCRICGKDIFLCSPLDIWILVLLTAANMLYAQAPTAEMTGRITDPSAAVIVGAQVTIKNTDTGIRRDTTSNELGSYTVPLLDPGNYEVTTTKEGFRPISRSGLSLHVGLLAPEHNIVKTENVLQPLVR
jgi:Carboxypeptidase regulatory-like domain